MHFHTLNPNLLLGYHGCDAGVGEALLAGQAFQPSENAYDWLGPGIYFWESNPLRALSFAEEQVDRKRIKKPFVVGAVLSLGRCVDTLNENCLSAITDAYDFLKETLTEAGEAMPVNSGSGLWQRNLDCAVLKVLHQFAEDEKQPIDSIRALYHEGGSLYPNAGFYKKSHVQIAICNTECIKGVFRVDQSALQL